MKLYKIIENIEIIDIIGDINIDIVDIQFDSRKVKQGSLFICVRGFSDDGHKFIDSAIKQGARAFLVEEDMRSYNQSEITFINVKNTRKSMARVASNFYNNPTEHLSVIGVTGTNGKTSVTTFLNQILNLNSKVGLIGTIKIDDGNEVIISNNTTPESLDLQRYFKNMLENNCKYCAMEVSSHSLALNRVEDIKFKVGVFTNLTPEHLDFHENLDNYRNAKELLFHRTSLANIINIDDAGGQTISSHVRGLKIPNYTYGIYTDADFMAKDIKLYQEGVSYELITPTYKSEIYVPVPGKFTIYNTLAVIGVCYVLDISIDVIKTGLENTIGVEGRFESLKNDKGISVIVDYAHTPDALKNALKTVREFAKGRIITVFGCGGDRDKSKRSVMGKIAQEYSDISIITSDNPRTEDSGLIIEDILIGIDRNKENYMVIESRKEAISKAISIAEVDDVVIITGKGHENYQIIGRTKYYFDDREIANEFINQK